MSLLNLWVFSAAYAQPLSLRLLSPVASAAADKRPPSDPAPLDSRATHTQQEAAKSEVVIEEATDKPVISDVPKEPSSAEEPASVPKPEKKPDDATDPPESPLDDAPADSPNASEQAKDAKNYEIDIGLGQGFTVRTKDHRYELTIGLRAMFLAKLEYSASTQDPLASNQVAVDFAVRRARVNLMGAAFDPRLRYRFQLAFAPQDMAMTKDGTTHYSPLMDAYIQVLAHRDIRVRFGQYVLRYNRSRVISSASMQLVDRAIATTEFQLDRDVGLQLSSDDFLGIKKIRYAVSVTTGEGRDALFNGNTGFLYLVNLDLLPLGLFYDYSEGDLTRSLQPRLALGLVYAFADRSERDGGTVGTPAAAGGPYSYHNFTANAYFVWQGFSVMTEWLWRWGWQHDPPPGAMTARDGWGTLFQLGYLVPRTRFEVAARYGATVPMDASPVENERELGVGVNYYFLGHAYKVQADVFQIWPDTGLLSTSRWDEGTTRVRLQVQTTF